MEEWDTGEYFTPEELHYAQDVYFTMGGDKLRHLLANVLTKVPREIVSKVLDNCLYLMPTPAEKAFYLPDRILKKKHIVLFPYTFLRQSKKEQVHTILHETAHYILGHKSPIEFKQDGSEPMEKYNKQEKEADALVKKWLKGEKGITISEDVEEEANVYESLINQLVELYDAAQINLFFVNCIRLKHRGIDPVELIQKRIDDIKE